MTSVLPAAVLAGVACLLATGEVGARRRVEAICRSTESRGWIVRSRDLAVAAWRRLRRPRVERVVREAMVEMCASLAAELRAGRPPIAALRLSVDALGSTGRELLSGVVVTAERGGDVPRAMRALAVRPGCRALGWLAACWEVGVESGAGLAEAVERLADALRAEQRARHEVSAQLAAPRATARLLAVLPVVGIAMATGLGQRPVSFLLGSPLGMACLIVGVAVDAVGVFWTSRLARSAEPG